MQKDYNSFLSKKLKSHSVKGLDPIELNKHLFPFQKYIVKNALKKGKYAIFADCGLGKTLMQLDWAYNVSCHTNKPVIILAPLGVRKQTIEEGLKFGIEVVDLRNMDASSKIVITNYEQIDHVDPSIFSGIVLDESSILKNFEGKIKTKILENFKDTDYKLACTATPSPNDPMELGNHAEFLDVMTRNEMLAMYFVHDGGQTAKWRLKGHSIGSFYQFVSSWACMISHPRDIGFEMPGYDLPRLNMIEHLVKTNKKQNGKLFNDIAVSATDFNAELRRSQSSRLSKVADMVNDSDESWIVWVRLNTEADQLMNMIPGAIEVRGSDKPSVKESRLLGFAKGEFRVMVTKSKIAQFGLNYQNCHNQIFASLDFSFESLYQSIRRSYRFGQDKEVNIHMISTDTMLNVVESIRTKQKEFQKMQNYMSNMISHSDRKEKEKLETETCANDSFMLKRGDCIELIRGIENDSIGLSIFSPPFADLYTYSSHVEDMGNSKDYNEFLEHFAFLAEELYRVMKPGRNVCIHCMDLPIQKGKEGFIGLRDFSGMILQLFDEVGFIYHSRVTIWKDPVVEMQRTKALGLLHKQIKKDSTMCRVGIPDYVLIFRKDGDRSDPVSNKEMPVDVWQKYASPVWMDINYSNTLQGFRKARDEKDEKHICPLQLETIERLVELYSNPGDIVFDPFLGIGSTTYVAVKKGRFGIGFELKESYYQQALSNCNMAMEELNQIELAL